MLKSHAVAIDESNTMNHPTPQGLPVRDLTDDEKQFLHYNPNTSDLVEFVQAYAREALAAQAATLESIHKIIECAGPEAADEIADLLGYPSVEWPSDQAASSPATAVMQVGCENIDGTLNIHPEMETCSICEPAQAVDAGDEWDAFQVWRTRQQVIADNRAEGDDWIDAAKQVDGFIAGYRAALQASRQTVTQQAVAEGAGGGLRQTLIDVGRVIAWQCFGDCRAYDEFGSGSLRGLHEMDAEIRAALANKEPK